jgi:hypothetical protein
LSAGALHGPSGQQAQAKPTSHNPLLQKCFQLPWLRAYCFSTYVDQALCPDCLRHVVFDVRKDNYNTLIFHWRFDAKETHEDEQEINLRDTKATFNADRDGHTPILGSEALI